MNDKIIIKGAKEHNLKNINIELPKNKFIVMTGVSGSGKSSLAFDTLCAEGERRYLESESMTSFFNDVGERARIVILDEMLRFDTSAFELNSGVTEIKNGLVAHFDPTKKKFIISDSASAHEDYANARDKFLVVSSEDDMEYLCGKETVRLEVMA